MADEISLHCSLSCVKGGVNINSNNGSFRATMAGSDAHKLSQTVTMTPAALEKGNVTTPGWMKAKNMSTTTGEIIRFKTSELGVNFAKLLPGCECLFMWDQLLTAPYVVSDLGSPLLVYEFCEA